MSRVEMRRALSHAKPDADLLRLESNRAYFDDGEGGATRLVLGWPLPGASVGRPFYQVYLVIPQPRTKCRFDTDSDSPDGAPPATGFLVQHRGREAGRADVTEGWVEVSPGSDQRSGRFDVQFSDGTGMAGWFRSVRSRVNVQNFEDLHVADRESVSTPAP